MKTFKLNCTLQGGYGQGSDGKNANEPPIDLRTLDRKMQNVKSKHSKVRKTMKTFKQFLEGVKVGSDRLLGGLMAKEFILMHKRNMIRIN